MAITAIRIQISGVADPGTVYVEVAGQAVPLDDSLRFSAVVTLGPGTQSVGILTRNALT